MFKNKMLKQENLQLKCELHRTQIKLKIATDKLSAIRTFERRYQQKCEAYQQRCPELEDEIARLKRENRQLELGNKAIKSVQIAHENYNNRKEA